MKHKLIVKEEAIEDMDEAFNWYEDRRTGLGVEFLNEVDAFFNHISDTPLLYQLHADQRIAVMHRFPYKIVYEIERNTVLVYAVYHDKRNPERLAERE